MPLDLGFIYIRSSSFQTQEWNSNLLRNSPHKDLIVVDLRHNGGGHNLIALALLRDLLYKTATPAVAESVYSEGLKFDASQVKHIDYLYE